MNYIKKVILENFQSHKYTEIEFDKHLNVIVGPSDQGKTAIIRGVKWALFNEPSGDYFIREGETESSVTVVFSNNTRIKRYRSKSKNYYYIYDSEGNETILEGFGTKVPEEIVEATSIKKILLDSNVSNSINIGEQLEGPFLLSEITSTRANAIGRLVGVHIVDDALKDTLKDIRNLKSKKRNHQETLEKLTTNLKEYDYLEELSLKSTKLKEIRNKIKFKEKRLNSLLDKADRIRNINDGIFLQEKYLSKLEKLDRISDIEKCLDIRIKKFSYIYKRYERLSVVNNHIDKDISVLKALTHISKIEGTYKVISDKEKKLEILTELYNKNGSVKDNILKDKDIVYKLKNVESIERNMGLIERKYNALSNILVFKNRLDKVNKSLSIGKIYVEKLYSLEPANNIKESIEIKYRMLEKVLRIKLIYGDIIQRWEDTRKKLTQVEVDMKKLLKQYENVLNNLEVCPVCYSSIDKERIEDVISSYK